MEKTKLSILVLSVMLIATLSTLIAPVNAGFIGDVPVIPFEKDPSDPNKLLAIGITDIWVTRGVVIFARFTNRIKLQTSASFTLKNGDPVAIIDPKDNPVRRDWGAEERKLRSVLILPVEMPIPEEEAAKIKNILDQGTSLIWTVKLRLVFIDRNGDLHTLRDGYLELTGYINPDERAPVLDGDGK